MTNFLKRGNRQPTQVASRVVLGAASLMVLALVSTVVPSLSASASPTNSFVVTGALSGTLKLGPVSSCSGSTNGAQLSSFSTTLSSKKFKNWAITITLAKPGAAAKKFNRSTASFVLQSGGLNGWVATKGSMTLGNKSGKVNLTLGAQEGSASGTVYIKGSWSCAG